MATRDYRKNTKNSVTGGHVWARSSVIKTNKSVIIFNQLHLAPSPTEREWSRNDPSPRPTHDGLFVWMWVYDLSRIRLQSSRPTHTSPHHFSVDLMVPQPRYVHIPRTALAYWVTTWRKSLSLKESRTTVGWRIRWRWQTSRTTVWSMRPPR